MTGIAALAWVTVPLIWEEPPISDAGIAMAVALLLFLSLTEIYWTPLSSTRLRSGLLQLFE